MHITVDLKTINTNRLIWTSTVDFCVIRSFSFFLDIPTGFRPFIKWRAKFQISRVLIRQSDWLNFIHFSGNKLKINLALRLIKSIDQALISIPTILKFSALSQQDYRMFLYIIIKLFNLYSLIYCETVKNIIIIYQHGRYIN